MGLVCRRLLLVIHYFGIIGFLQVLLCHYPNCVGGGVDSNVSTPITNPRHPSFYYLRNRSPKVCNTKCNNTSHTNRKASFYSNYIFKKIMENKKIKNAILSSYIVPTGCFDPVCCVLSFSPISFHLNLNDLMTSFHPFSLSSFHPSSLSVVSAFSFLPWSRLVPFRSSFIFFSSVSPSARYSSLACSPSLTSDSSLRSLSCSKSSCLPAPHVFLKLAMDSAGGIDDRHLTHSHRFTGPAALALVHSLRNASDVVLTGSSTVMRDDCRLTVREEVMKRGEQGEKKEKGMGHKHIQHLVGYNNSTRHHVVHNDDDYTYNNSDTTILVQNPAMFVDYDDLFIYLFNNTHEVEKTNSVKNPFDGGYNMRTSTNCTTTTTHRDQRGGGVENRIENHHPWGRQIGNRGFFKSHYSRQLSNHPFDVSHWCRNHPNRDNACKSLQEDDPKKEASMHHHHVFRQPLRVVLDSGLRVLGGDNKNLTNYVQPEMLTDEYFTIVFFDVNKVTNTTHRSFDMSSSPCLGDGSCMSRTCGGSGPNQYKRKIFIPIPFQAHCKVRVFDTTDELINDHEVNVTPGGDTEGVVVRTLVKRTVVVDLPFQRLSVLSVTDKLTKMDEMKRKRQIVINNRMVGIKAEPLRKSDHQDCCNNTYSFLHKNCREEKRKWKSCLPSTGVEKMVSNNTSFVLRGEERRAKVVVLEKKKLDLSEVLDVLRSCFQAYNIMVEAGPAMFQTALPRAGALALIRTPHKVFKTLPIKANVKWNTDPLCLKDDACGDDILVHTCDSSEMRKKSGPDTVGGDMDLETFGFRLFFKNSLTRGCGLDANQFPPDELRCYAMTY